MLPVKFGSIWPSSFRGEDFFRNQPIRNKNCLWRPCLLTDRDEMSNLYRGPSIDAFYQITVHLSKRFQRRRFFRNRPIRNKNCLWRPCLLTDRDEMSILYRGPSIDASYQVSVQLAMQFQERNATKYNTKQTQSIPLLIDHRQSSWVKSGMIKARQKNTKH